MANKTATLLIIDCSPTMAASKLFDNKVVSEGRSITRLNAAAHLAAETLKGNLVSARKTDIVGLVFFSCEETQNELASDGMYQGVIAHEFKTADIDMAKMIEHDLPDGSDESTDVIDAIIVGMDLMTKKCRNLKYDRRIFVFTDAEGKTNFEDEEALDTIGAQLKQAEISLTIVGLDFDDPETGFRQLNKPPHKAENERSLREFCTKHDQSLFSTSESAKYILGVRTKTVRPTTVYRGPLSIGGPDGLGIPVHAFNKTSTLSAPSAKKTSALKRADPNQPYTGLINLARMFYLPAPPQDDQQPGQPVPMGPQVDAVDVRQAYRFGRRLVPMDVADKEAAKLQTTEGLEVLGTLYLRDIPRYYFLEKTLFIQADPKDTAGCLYFSAICEALIKEEICFLVRYVSGAGRSPRIGVLFGGGDLEDRKQRLYFAQLPFSQDVRKYAFVDIMKVLEPPANRASKRKHKWDTRQQDVNAVEEAMDDWIESMDLMEAGPDGTEAYRSNSVYQPLYHRTWQCVAFRALHPTDPLPELEPWMKTQLAPNEALLDKASDAFDDLKTMFSAPYKVIKAKRRKLATEMYVNTTERQGGGRWYEKGGLPGLAKVMAQQGEEGDSADKPSQEPSQALPSDSVEDMGMKHFLGDQFTDTVSRSEPIKDFLAMVSNRNVDMIADAVSQLANVILINVQHGTPEAHELAIKCLQVLRATVLDEDEVGPYQNFMQRLKADVLLAKSRKTKSFWDKWRTRNQELQGKIGPIRQKEHALGLTKEEMDAFFDAEAGEEGVVLLSAGSKDAAASSKRSSARQEEEEDDEPVKPKPSKKKDNNDARSRSPPDESVKPTAPSPMIIHSDSEQEEDPTYARKPSTVLKASKRANVDEDSKPSSSSSSSSSKVARGKSPARSAGGKSASPAKGKSQSQSQPRPRGVFDASDDEDD